MHLHRVKMYWSSGQCELFLYISFLILYQVPVSKFHELRYNVALILKEMNNLEKRSILQIQD